MRLRRLHVPRLVLLDGIYTMCHVLLLVLLKKELLLCQSCTELSLAQMIEGFLGLLHLVVKLPAKLGEVAASILAACSSLCSNILRVTWLRALLSWRLSQRHTHTHSVQ